MRRTQLLKWKTDLEESWSRGKIWHMSCGMSFWIYVWYLCVGLITFRKNLSVNLSVDFILIEDTVLNGHDKNFRQNSEIPMGVSRSRFPPSVSSESNLCYIHLFMFAESLMSQLIKERLGPRPSNRKVLEKVDQNRLIDTKYSFRDLQIIVSDNILSFIFMKSFESFNIFSMHGFKLS